jgi:hypothetical protein
LIRPQSRWAQCRELETTCVRRWISLLDISFSAIECLRVARKTTRDVSEVCDKTLSNISLKLGAPKRPGRITCALIVIEAWDFARGGPPGANNPKAQKACEDYWRAYGGPPIGKGEPGNWRKTIKDALADRSALRRYIRDEIRFEAERRSSELSAMGVGKVRKRR